MTFKTCTQILAPAKMYKKNINTEELKQKQSAVCELISQIWDAESLDIILGSVQNIIKVKKLVMLVDTSCGPTQPTNINITTDQHQPGENTREGHEQEEAAHGEAEAAHLEGDEEQGDEEQSDDENSVSWSGGECESDMGDSPDEDCDNGTMQMNEDGEYLTQIYMDTLPPPRIKFVQQLELDTDSLFGDIEDISNETDNNNMQEAERQDDRQAGILVQQQVQNDDDEEERRRVVTNYINTPLEQIHAQCPYTLTKEEVDQLFGVDFSQTQSNFFL